MKMEEQNPKKKKVSKWKVFSAILVSLLLVFGVYSYIGYRSLLSNNEIPEYYIGNRTLESVTPQEINNAVKTDLIPLKGLANSRIKVYNSSGGEVIGWDHNGSVVGLGNLTFNSTTAQSGGYGFFAYVGDSVNKVLKGFFKNIQVDQTVNASNITLNDDVYIDGTAIDDIYLRISEWNATNTSYRELTNNTFVANISISNNYITNGTGGDAIWHNSSGWCIGSC
jgi:hypothetical protein